MVITLSKSETGSPSCHEALALSLINCMGRESAIHVCRINGWDGVLEVIQENMPEPHKALPLNEQ